MRPSDSPPPDSFRTWNFWRRWLGQRSERTAARFLQQLGWRIIARNIADAHGEIDLLCWDKSQLIVVEVRSTSQSDPQIAADSVNFVKQKKVTQAAHRFLQRKRLLGTNLRFDILAIAWPANQSQPTVLHIPYAFESHDRFQIFS